MAKSIMIQGTMSNVGKSIITAGLCRIFRQDGYPAAPFKSQNMALNSYITGGGLEMGRAQAVQAEAGGIAPDVRMNPILLKPTSDMGSQVIVMGEPAGNMRAMDYMKRKKEYLPLILEAYESLAEEYEVIVIEGAGSPAEINLKQDDIVNMGLAAAVNAPVLLVGDIDRGGVFAQLAGTLLLLDEEERRRVKGLIINKFRGDRRILAPGLTMLEDRCGKEVLGTVPYTELAIEEEDSLAQGLAQAEPGGMVDIAVIRLPRISNFTDFQAFALEEAVSVRYVDKAARLGSPDVVILPGTKNTMKDLKWLRESGLEAAVLRLAHGGGLVFGICGGFQMLGERIEDACGAEGGGTVRGMGLLPVLTRFGPEKTRTRMEGRTAGLGGPWKPLSGCRVSGYEIHMGQSAPLGPDGQYATALHGCCDPDHAGNAGGQYAGEKQDGCFAGNVMGTYLHGIFDGQEFRRAFVRLLCERKQIDYEGSCGMSLHEYKELQYDRLASVLRQSLNMPKIYEILEGGG